VLLDHDAVLGDLFDRDDVQRGGLQRLVLALEPVDLPAEVRTAFPCGFETLLKLVVHG